MKKKKKEELPDYTVADMDVEGMPWNSKKDWQMFPGPDTKHRLNQPLREDLYGNGQRPPMTREERRSAIWLCLKAALSVALIFCGAFLIFILFCVFVWLK